MESNKVPELRFPEFEGEWEEEKIKDITSKVGSGKTPKGGDKVYLEKGIPFIRSQNIINDSLVLDNTHISEKTHVGMKSSRVVANDILLNITGASIGRSCVVPHNFKEGNVNQHVCIIRLDNGNSKFLQSYLSSWRGQKLVFQGQTGSGREGLNFKSINGFKIAFPSLPEQTKIATFLTTIDQRIQLLEKKKSDLEQYKKGVMQKLFPPKGGQAPEIRFKQDDGTDFPDWEEKKLGEVLDYEQPTKYLVTDTEYSDEYKTPVLTAGKTFLLGYTDETKGVFENLPTIIFDDFTTAYQFVDFPFKAKSSAMKMLIPKFKGVNMKFVFEAMNTIRFPLAEHKRYWISEYQKEKIPYPKEEEQQKIANFLSTIDKKIEKTAEQIETSKAFKKGLLQKMFV